MGTAGAAGALTGVSEADVPGLRKAGGGTFNTLARWDTSRKRAVWYWTATLPLKGVVSGGGDHAPNKGMGAAVRAPLHWFRGELAERSCPQG